MYLYLSIRNGQPRETALCQLYRHTFVPKLKSTGLLGQFHIMQSGIILHH